MDVSVVIPLWNEEESIRELVAWNEKTLTTNNFSYELILIDDGSTDNSWKVIEALADKHKNLHAIKFRVNYGKAAALHEGFKIAKGDLVVTMDADLQDSPEEIPEFYKMIMEDGFDMVSGWKKKRHDPFSKRFPSKVWNGWVRVMSGIRLNDFNCGLKAYRNSLVKSIEVYGEMHRYIPVLAKMAGYNKIGEKEVQHQARKYGASKYGFERFTKGFLDLLNITFMAKFGKRPMHFFGTLGILSFVSGFSIGLYLSIDKLFFKQYKIADRPLFYLGILAMIIGSQLFMTGFLGEMINRNASERNKYDIEKKL
jgi:glycosyltransferase involved in cell wall biosynthesis